MTTHHGSGASDRRYVRLVRTTLKIDDDVLEAAQCIADDEQVSVGEILSRLARRGLEPRPDEPAWTRLPPPTVPLAPAAPRRAIRRLREVWEPW